MQGFFYLLPQIITLQLNQMKGQYYKTRRKIRKVRGSIIITLLEITEEITLKIKLQEARKIKAKITEEIKRKEKIPRN